MRDGDEENRRENLREKAWELKQKNSERAGDVIEAEELNKKPGDAVEVDEEAIAAEEPNKQGAQASSSRKNAQKSQKTK